MTSFVLIDRTSNQNQQNLGKPAQLSNHLTVDVGFRVVLAPGWRATHLGPPVFRTVKSHKGMRSCARPLKIICRV